jgi:glycerate kinase
VIDLKAIEFRVACDVSNPLFGDEGAARVYAPQKGADAAMVETLEQGMIHFALVLKQELGVDVGQTAGAGAAGGMGAGSLAFLRAALVSGIELVMQVAHFEQHLKKADVVITGEGKIDDQTLKGKVVMGIAAAAQKSGKKIIAFCGSQAIASNSLAAAGISAVFPIVKYPMDWEEAKSKAYAFLKDTAFSVGNLLQ